MCDCFHIFVDGSDLGEQSAAWTQREFFFHGALCVLVAGAVATEITLNSTSGERWQCYGQCCGQFSTALQATVRDAL